MRQLTSLDVQFLAAEDGRPHGHVSAVSILDPATAPEGKLTLADITRVFRERLHLLPPLCWRLVEVPLGLDYPRWLDDPDFDLEFHLRELHLPPPGNLDQLADQASRIVSRPLDRSRPLWECYLIGGLEHGNVALLIKIHHAVVDGVSGAEILGMLFDTDAGGRQLPPAPLPDGDPTPGTSSLLPGPGAGVTARFEIRPIEPDDKEKLLDGFERLGDRSRYRRFLAPHGELSAEELRYFTEVDHHDHEALVAIDPVSGDGVGVARFVRSETDPSSAEIAFAVVDDRQRQGVGSHLAAALVERARTEGITTFTAILLADNDAMLGLLDDLGRVRVLRRERGTVEVSVEFPAAALDRLRTMFRRVGPESLRALAPWHLARRA